MSEPYYDDGQCVIYHGDCREILSDVAGGLLVTDPPYGISLNNDWQNEIHEKRRSARNRASGGILNDNGEDDWAGLCAMFDRRIVFGFPYLLDTTATGWLVWDKEPGFSGRSLTSPIEMAYSTTWRGFRAIRLLWSGYMRAPGSEPKFGHPTQKSESLMRHVIAYQDDPLVVDLFMGSGTTLRAAKDLGRKAIGVEIEERYCEIAAKRLAQGVLDFGEAS